MTCMSFCGKDACWIMVNNIDGIKIHSISCAVPHHKLSLVEYAPDLFTEKSAKRMAKGTGFSALRITDDDTTTSDLCAAAAEHIFADVDRNSVGALVFVTQTPDYVLPATSHILQDRLGLKNDVLCIDVNEGCSGYVTGVYMASVLAKQLNSRVCLLRGDTITKLTLSEDRATRCIFGDAGTATIIEPGEQNVPFSFASYGERCNAIIMENSRHRTKENPVNDGKLYLDGLGIMNFTLNEVPEIMQKIVVEQNISLQDISLFACHQANRMILQSLAEKLQGPAEKIPFTAGECGNESSASIPMVLTASDKESLSNVMCCGFGVGLSAGAFLYDFTDTDFYGVYEI